MIPSFLKSLSQENVKNIFLTGCGGGFDFVHTLLLYKELNCNLGKNVIIGSYSFGSPEQIEGGDIVFQKQNLIVRKVDGSCSNLNFHYLPEISLCQFLDREHPDQAPHFIYAYYARAFCIPVLCEFYEQICSEHEVHAIVSMDGGSDSLMAGDESGLGDPIEDAVSIGAISRVSTPTVIFRFLMCVGLGADRFNDVSDASSLRAISELTEAGGFLGGICIEPSSEGFLFYKKALDYIYTQQQFQSVLSGVIVCSVEGCYGSSTVPDFLKKSRRVKRGDVFLWPLSGIIWAFNINVVAERSKIVSWISECTSPHECARALFTRRSEIFVKAVEELPVHKEYCIVDEY